MVEVGGCDSAAGGGAFGRVLIVEDHRLLADALALGLQDRGLPCRVATLGKASQVVQQAVEWRPTLVLLDLDLGPIDGLDLVGGLRSAGARVLVVSGCRDEARLAAAVALGAVGWVSKSGPFEELLQAAELAARDQPLVAPTRREALAVLGRRHLDGALDLKARMGLLTDRELQVLGAMADGLSAQQMAERFVVSIGTIRSHIRAVLTKLGVSTQLAAVALAQQLAVSWRGRGEVPSTVPLPVGDHASVAPAASAF
jgi:DNA-binding NarL/FixJ family response regulator